MTHRDTRPLVQVLWDVLAVLAVRSLHHFHAVDACSPDLAPRQVRISVPMYQLAALARELGAPDGYRAAAEALCDLDGLRHDDAGEPVAHITAAAVPPLTESVDVHYRLPLPSSALAGNPYRDRPAGPVDDRALAPSSPWTSRRLEPN